MRTQRWVSSHVVVEPRRLGNFGFASVSDELVSRNRERDYKDRCDAIVNDIKRHVDSVGSATRVDETEPVCEFCGRAWTEDSPAYNGGCCDRDETNKPPSENPDGN